MNGPLVVCTLCCTLCCSIKDGRCAACRALDGNVPPHLVIASTMRGLWHPPRQTTFPEDAHEIIRALDAAGFDLVKRLERPPAGTRWTHINDALPPFGDWVLVGGWRKSGVWWVCAKRVRRCGGGWEWENDEDEPRFGTLEYWALVDEPPASRSPPPPQEASEAPAP